MVKLECGTKNVSSAPAEPAPRSNTALRRGESLVEMVVAIVIMGSLIAAFLPRFQRSLEQARADVAGANLRAIWAAERLYWLENPSRTYTGDLGVLVSGKYLDPALDPANQPPGAPYTYAISVSPNGTAFLAAIATRSASGVWTGSFSVSGDGAMSGSVQRPGDSNSEIKAGFQ